MFGVGMFGSQGDALVAEVTTALIDDGATVVSVTSAARQKYVEGVVRQQVAAMLGVDHLSLDTATVLSDCGLSSLSWWQLAEALEQALGVTIVVTRLLDPRMTIAGLATWIIGEAVCDDGKVDTVVSPEVMEAHHTLNVVRAALKRVIRQDANLSTFPNAERQYEARGTFPFALTRFEDSSLLQVSLFFVWAPFGLVLALVRRWSPCVGVFKRRAL